MHFTDKNTIEERIPLLKVVMKKLPKPNYEVLVFICEFLKYIAEHAEQNKMTVSMLSSR